MVAGDAARALGALRDWASPSVGALVKTLAHKDPYVRVYAAEALAIWGSLHLGGNHLYVGNVGGTMTVLRAGRHKELLAQIKMDAPLYSRPAQVGDALY